MKYLVHFYYGDRFETFYTALGTLVRSSGHSLDAYLIVVGNYFQSVLQELGKTNVCNVVSVPEPSYLQEVFLSISHVKDAIIFIINFDLALNEETAQNYLSLLEMLNESNEIVITAKNNLSSIAEKADYISAFNQIY